MRRPSLAALAASALLSVFFVFAPSIAWAYDPIVPELGLATGAWADKVPIECPPGPAGAAPTLAIAHQHTVPDGALGTGFFLAGTSVISRHSEKGGVPGHTWSDSYKVDGRPLVMVAAGGVYEPQTHDGTRFWLDSATNTWTMKKDGWTWTYGSTGSTGINATKKLYGANGRSQLDTTPFPFDTASGPCSSSTALCNTAAWYLSQAVDPNGNVLKYDYTNETMPASLAGRYFESNTRDRQLSKVTYAGGNATIDLFYEERPDPRLSIASGTPTFLAHRLQAIVSRGAGGLFYARYELEYKDASTDSIAAGDVDRLRDNPIQTLLRRVWRTSEDGTARRLVRAYDTWNEDLTWTSEDITSAIPIPWAIWGSDARVWSSPIPLNINGDGASDLALLSYQCGPVEIPSGAVVVGCIADHHVYVATPGAAEPFADASASADAAAWEDELFVRAGGLAVFNNRGYAIGDINRDGTPEILWEDPATGQVSVSWYLRTTRSFTTGTLPATAFTPSDLRRAQLADVDGDGFPDAILKPSANTTQWIRNLGAPPWFDRSSLETLAVPLESATPPADWTSLKTAHCAGKSPVPHGFTGSDAQHYANESRFADMNGDGLVDIVYSLHACWHDWSSNDTPIEDTLFSRIFWGDGYGAFVDSGLAAGPAFNSLSPGSPDVVSSFSAADLDRDGHVELVQASSPGVSTHVNGAYDRGLILGYALDPVDDYAPSDFSLHVPALAGGSREHFAALADFDGDGFSDVLEVQYPTHNTGSGWADMNWEVRLRRSTRTAAQGRVVGAHDAWGGTTSLEWGFSAEAGSDNPDLPVNVEVLAQVIGSEGTVKVRYAQGGYEGSSGLTGFGLVERRNARDGSELFGFATIPALAGAPTHAVRYRTDGTIEAATVYVNGSRAASGAWSIDLAPPFDNPLIRKCDFDLGFGAPTAGAVTQSYDVQDLIHDCYAFGAADTSTIPSEAQILVAQGRYRYPPDALGNGIHELANAVWASPGGGAQSVTLAWPAEDTGNRRFDFPLPWTEARTIGFRWTPPAGVATPPLLAPGSGAAAYPTATLPTARAFYATDWTYDSAHLLLSAREHRDTSTTADDRIHTPTYSVFDTSKWGRKLTRSLTTGVSGDQLVRVTRSSFDPASFDHARTVETCGTSTVGCPTEQFTWGSTGDLTGHTFADATTESWTRAWCGEELTHTDQVGRTRTHTLDGRCLTTTHTFQGAKVDYVYDTFLRQTKRTLHPNGNVPNPTIDTYYDDDLAIAADGGFAEPRMGEKRGDGRLVLTYLDDFGRVTRKVGCTAASGTGNPQDGVLASVKCQSGTATVVEYNLYGDDGALQATARPFSETEAVRLSGYTRDGFGRVIVAQEPAHVDGAGASQWVTEVTRHGPTWIESVDPLGVVSRVTSTTLSEVTQEAGVTRRQVAFNAAGDATSVTAADGLTTSLYYDVLHRVDHEVTGATAACVLANGTIATCTRERFWKYDAMGRVGRVIDPAGTIVDRTYDAAGRLDQVWLGPAGTGKLLQDTDYVPAASASSLAEQRVTGEAGNTVVMTMDGFGKPRAITVLGATESIAYGPSGLPTSATDKNGFVTTFTYDPLDRLATATSTATGTTTYLHDGDGHLTRTTDADGVIEARSYTQSGDLAEIQRGPYTLLRRTYDAAGQVIEELDSGVLSRAQYDALGRPTHRDLGVDAATNVASSTEDLTWDAGDRPLTSTLAPTAGGSTRTTWTYDAWGRAHTEARPDSGTTIVDYDIVDRPRFVTDGEGYRLEARYDTRGRATYREKPGRGADTIAFTSPASFGATNNLALTAVTDPDGFVNKVYTDALGRPVFEVRPDGSYVERQFTGAQLTEERWRDAAAALLRTRRYQYSAQRGLLTRVDGPATSAELSAGTEHRVSRTYTAAGRTATIGTFDETTTYGYADGFLASEAWGSLTRTLARADLVRPWVTTETLAGGASQRVRTFDRDPAGRMELEIVTAGGHTITRSFSGHDAYGRPSETASYRDGVLDARDVTTFDHAGRPVQRDSYLGATPSGTTLWEWFKNGALKAQRTPSGKWMAYDYGASFDGSLDRVHDRAGTNYARFTARNGRGLPTAITLISETLALTYDSLGRLTKREGTSATYGNSTWERTFDASGFLRDEKYVDGAATWHNLYDYDGAGRLVHESRGKTAEVYDYAVDRAGKRLSTSRSVNGGASSVILSATYSGTKLATVTSGGTTKTIAYDAWEAVTTDQNGYSFARNADGSLRSVTNAGTTTTITRDARGVPVAIDEGFPDPRILTRGLDPEGLPIEIQEPDGDDVTYVEAEGMLLSRLAPGSTSVVLRDSADSVSRYRSTKLDHGSAFGVAVTGPSADERYLFAGMERLPGAPSIELAQHREYDPSTGRFLSPDPTGLAGGPHRTLYADGNPVQKRDPQGLLAISIDSTIIDYSGFMGVLPGQPYIPPGDTASDDTMPPAIDIGALTTARPGGCFPMPTGGLGVADIASTTIDPKTDKPPKGSSTTKSDRQARKQVRAVAREARRREKAMEQANRENEEKAADRAEADESEGAGKDKHPVRRWIRGLGGPLESASRTEQTERVERALGQDFERSEAERVTREVTPKTPGLRAIMPTGSLLWKMFADYYYRRWTVFAPQTTTVVLYGPLAQSTWDPARIADVIHDQGYWLNWTTDFTTLFGYGPYGGQSWAPLSQCKTPGGCDLSRARWLVIDAHGGRGYTVGIGDADEFAKALVDAGFHGDTIILYTCNGGVDASKFNGQSGNNEPAPSVAATLARETGADVIAVRGIESGRNEISTNLAGKTYADPDDPTDAGEWVIFHPDGTMEPYYAGDPAPAPYTGH